MDQQNGKGEGSLEHPSADQDSGLCPVERSPRADIDPAAISASVWPGLSLGVRSRRVALAFR